MKKLLNTNVINQTRVKIFPSLRRTNRNCCRLVVISVIILLQGLKLQVDQRQVELANPEEINGWQGDGKSSELLQQAENKTIAAAKGGNPLAAKVVVATLFTSKDNSEIYKGLSFRTIETNFQKYSESHGYDLHIKRELPKFKRLPSCKSDCLPIETKWFKIQLIINLLDKGYEWVFWTDADTLFTNLTQQLPIPQGTSDSEIIFSGDKSMVNSGHILSHNSPWTLKFLKAQQVMKKARHIYHLEDNSGLVVLLALGIEDALKRTVSELGRIEHNDAHTRQKVKTQEDATRVMGQKMHNSFKGKIKIVPQNVMNAYPDTWKVGCLLVHLAGYEYANGDWVRKMGFI